MKIAVISTTVFPCLPPDKGGYGGLEPIAWLHANGLSRRGHEVLLVAPIGSEAPPGVELHGTTLGESEEAAYSGYWKRLPNFEILIDHSWNKFSYILKMEGKLKSPVLGFLHAPCDTMFRSAPPVTYPCFVAISEDQAAHASQLWGVSARVCYHGIPSDIYKPIEGVTRNDRYLFLARMSTIKGPHIAADACCRARVPLDLVGDDRFTQEPALAQRLRNQALDSRGQIEYIGPVERKKTIEFYSTRKAMIHANRFFREPFGLAPLEAQLCGLPVIAWDNGAMRETVKHGETGFLVKSEDEIVSLLKDHAVEKIKPERCREWAMQFSVDRMIGRLEVLCKEALETPW